MRKERIAEWFRRRAADGGSVGGGGSCVHVLLSVCIIGHHSVILDSRMGISRKYQRLNTQSRILPRTPRRSGRESGWVGRLVSSMSRLGYAFRKKSTARAIRRLG